MRRKPTPRFDHLAKIFACAFLATLGLAAASGAEEPRQAAAAGVEVELSEYAIAMPATLAAGPTTFTLHNTGKKNHSFKIAGPGIDQLLAKPVRPHETATLQLTLQPGEYKVYCPIGSHAIKGMTTTLKVTPKPGKK
jgi:uncharacterized cupredoxin-like copper-binding protein